MDFGSLYSKFLLYIMHTEYSITLFLLPEIRMHKKDGAKKPLAGWRGIYIRAGSDYYMHSLRVAISFMVSHSQNS